MSNIQVGLCSRKRAEYLMMSAAVAGGAVYVECPEIPGVTPTVEDDHYRYRYLCCGEGVPEVDLSAPAVLSALRSELGRLSEIRTRTRTTALDDLIDEVGGVLASLERYVSTGSTRES